MNSKTWAVVRREFVTRVYTKTFVITTILLPVMLFAFALVPMLLMQSSVATTRVAVVDATGGSLGQRVVKALAAQKMGDDKDSQARFEVSLIKANAADVAQIQKKLIGQTGFSSHDAKGKYDGILVIPAAALDAGKLSYYGSNASSLQTMAALRGGLSKVFAASRLAGVGIDLATVKRAMKPVALSTVRVSDGKLTGQSGGAAYAVAYGMGILLYMAIVIFGQRTMTSVIEEKTSRVMEVLVSSLTPFQMLMGKVLGVGGAGLLQMAIWGVSAWAITSQAGHIAGMFGASAATASSLTLPVISGGLVVIFLVYFSLGFLLYGALYAAVGSTCNTVHETQQYSFIVTVPILLGFFATFGIIANPTGTLGTILSWIPFFAPFAMPVRWSLTTVSTLNLAGSLVLMVVVMVGCVWLAARIYHTGILMFGKKPSWRELWRWIRVS